MKTFDIDLIRTILVSDRVENGILVEIYTNIDTSCYVDECNVKGSTKGGVGEKGAFQIRIELSCKKEAVVKLMLEEPYVEFIVEWIRVILI